MTKNSYQKEKQNKGFTLVEVLIAVTILSIIVAPLLHAFVTGAKTNAKAKQIMKSTTLAQNVMEQVKAYSIEDIARQFNGNGFSSDNTMTADSASFYEAVKDASNQYVAVKTPDEALTEEEINSSVRDTIDPAAHPEGVFVGQEDDEYAFFLNKVSMESSNYDIQIFMEPNPSKGTANLTQINAMNRKDCAYFAQDDSDNNAAVEFELRNAEYPNKTADLSDEDFRQMMSREITIDIIDAGSDNYSVKVTYQYTIPSGYTAEADRYYEEYSTIFDNYGSREDLKAVYLYYFPLYGVGRTDTLSIVNKANLDVDIFLIKMQGVDYSDATENTYAPYINLTETSAKDGKSNAVICTNIKSDPSTITNKTHKVSSGSPGTIIMKDLGNTQETGCLYDVTIKVYKHDASAPYGEDNLLTTFTGSVLDNSEKRAN